jgi:hypothetical protein
MAVPVGKLDCPVPPLTPRHQEVDAEHVRESQQAHATLGPANPVNSARTRADTARMTGLTVTRWRRYGKDRLYVNADDGTRVGWLDVATGEWTLERDDLREAFERALAEHELPAAAVAGALEPAPPPTPPPPPPPATLQPMEPYALRITRRDLGVNKAGQAAREQAVAHRRAARVKTLAARVRDVHTDERAWRIGADGEEKVAARLGRLPEPWKVLHALPVGTRGSDIDHLALPSSGLVLGCWPAEDEQPLVHLSGRNAVALLREALADRADPREVPQCHPSLRADAQAETGQRR